MRPSKSRRGAAPTHGDGYSHKSGHSRDSEVNIIQILNSEEAHGGVPKKRTCSNRTPKTATVHRISGHDLSAKSLVRSHAKPWDRTSPAVDPSSSRGTTASRDPLEELKKHRSRMGKKAGVKETREARVVTQAPRGSVSGDAVPTALGPEGHDVRIGVLPGNLDTYEEEGTSALTTRVNLGHKLSRRASKQQDDNFLPPPGLYKAMEELNQEICQLAEDLNASSHLAVDADMHYNNAKPPSHNHQVQQMLNSRDCRQNPDQRANEPDEDGHRWPAPWPGPQSRGAGSAGRCRPVNLGGLESRRGDWHCRAGMDPKECVVEKLRARPTTFSNTLTQSHVERPPGASFSSLQDQGKVPWLPANPWSARLSPVDAVGDQSGPNKRSVLQLLSGVPSSAPMVGNHGQLHDVPSMWKYLCPANSGRRSSGRDLLLHHSGSSCLQGQTQPPDFTRDVEGKGGLCQFLIPWGSSDQVPAIQPSENCQPGAGSCDLQWLSRALAQRAVHQRVVRQHLHQLEMRVEELEKHAKGREDCGEQVLMPSIAMRRLQVLRGQGGPAATDMDLTIPGRTELCHQLSAPSRRPHGAARDKESHLVGTRRSTNTDLGGPGQEAPSSIHGGPGPHHWVDSMPASLDPPLACPQLLKELPFRSNRDPLQGTGEQGDPSRARPMKPEHFTAKTGAQLTSSEPQGPQGSHKEKRDIALPDDDIARRGVGIAAPRNPSSPMSDFNHKQHPAETATCRSLREAVRSRSPRQKNKSRVPTSVGIARKCAAPTLPCPSSSSCTSTSSGETHLVPHRRKSVLSPSSAEDVHGSYPAAHVAHSPSSSPTSITRPSHWWAFTGSASHGDRKVGKQENGSRRERSLGATRPASQTRRYHGPPSWQDEEEGQGRGRTPPSSSDSPSTKSNSSPAQNQGEGCHVRMPRESSARTCSGWIQAKGKPEEPSCSTGGVGRGLGGTGARRGARLKGMMRYQRGKRV